MALDSSTPLTPDADADQAGPGGGGKRGTVADSDRYYLVDEHSRVLVRSGAYIPSRLVRLPHVRAILVDGAYAPDPKAKPRRADQ